MFVMDENGMSAISPSLPPTWPVSRDSDVPGRRRFTLIELLVVVAIIGALAAMLLPSLMKARDRARAVSCTALLKQYGLATAMYVGDHEDEMPFRYTTAGSSPANLVLMSWRDVWPLYADYVKLGGPWYADTYEGQKATYAAGFMPVAGICPGAVSFWETYRGEAAAATVPVGGDYAARPSRYGSWGNAFTSRLINGNYKQFVGQKKITDIVDPTRTFVLNDAGFSGRYSWDRTQLLRHHDAGYNALFADGHADLFSQPNRYPESHWTNYYTRQLGL